LDELDNINFYIPITLQKGKTDDTGKTSMKFGGIASTNMLDLDGEILEPSGFDVSVFLNDGYFNWAHQSGDPSLAAIGYPTKAEIKNNKMYVEGEFYNTPLAKKVYELAETLEKSNSGRSLHFSIEGKALERKSKDKNHPDFKHVTKAAITHCAVCLVPKNPGTKMSIIKGMKKFDIIKSEINGNEVEAILDLTTEEGRIVVDKELNLIKDMTTTSGTSGQPGETNPIMKESLEGSQKNKSKNKKMAKKLVKSFIFSKIKNYIYDIKNAGNEQALLEAEEKYSFMEKNKETLKKSFDLLGLNDLYSVFEKGEKSESADDEGDEKDKDKKKKEGEKDAEGVTDKMEKSVDSTESAEVVDPVTTPIVATEENKTTSDLITKGDIETIIKGFADQNSEKTNELIKAFGEVVNAIHQKSVDETGKLLKSLNETDSLVKSQGDIIEKLNERIASVENEPVQRAITATSHIEKGFSNAGSQVPETVLSISNNYPQIRAILDSKVDWSNIQKGEGSDKDKFWKDAACKFEASKFMSPATIEKLRAENIVIVA
jgi:hypothetical protein